MTTKSVNGKLVPVGNITITDQYIGHFLKVSYSQMIENHAVFSKDRVDVDQSGEFRFFVPEASLTINQMVNIEIFAPDGEMLGKQILSHGSLNVSDTPINTDDASAELVLDVDPKIIVFNESSPINNPFVKISGKVINISGEKKPSSLNLIIMASDDATAEFDSSTYEALLATTTDKDGYFYGLAINSIIKKAFGVIAGNEFNPIAISLEDNHLPENILLVTDLSGLDVDSDCICNEAVPGLPDSSDLVNSGAFSQDIGGQCVDFTVPNRTLEEFSFYHTVRTTEPEIKGLTITSKDSKDFKAELNLLSTETFAVIGRLNSSFNSLTSIPFSVEEETTLRQSSLDDTPGLSPASSTGADVPTRTVQTYLPNYVFKLNVGTENRLRVNSNDLLKTNREFQFLGILKLVKEQAQRRKQLLALQQKLAAAYCGKFGVEQAKTFCEKLAESDSLNRAELKLIIRQLRNSRDSVQLSAVGNNLFDEVTFSLEKLISTKTTESKVIKAVIKQLEKVARVVEELTGDTQAQGILLGVIRKVLLELTVAAESAGLGFEPCVISENRETKGILCLIQEFNAIKEALRNTSILSLAEIISIRTYYSIFVESISSFMSLLDEFFVFYNSSSNFATEIADNYFFEEYQSIKSTLALLKRQIMVAILKIERIERAYILNHPGRVNLSVENSIDWDDTPTIYENTTIANGHILHFKQKWKADGYSLGDLLYSLPLAPCQEKQIAIIDWDRSERGSRTEAEVVSEELDANISRDRDITDIISSSLNESIVASSSNNTSSTSAGIGGGIGGFIGTAVFGIAGGVSHSGASSNSTANQNSSRNISASSLNRLQDSTSQSASSLRTRRSTVIQTVGQNETVSAQTEVIKNNNHCHAMTVEYFEVLKHYAIEQELVDVQECLFVPLPMSLFDHKKVLRWKNTLRRKIFGRKLRKGFEAIERIESNYVNSDLPAGSYADEVIEEFSGYFTITFDLKRPFIKTIDEATKTEEYDLSIPFPWFIGNMVFHLEREVPLTEAERDTIFEEDYVPDIVRSFVDRIQLDAIADDGSIETLSIDVTLLSNYRKGVPLKVNIATKATQNISRRQIKHLRFRAMTDVKPTSKIILRSTYLSYRTRHLSEYIIRNSRVNNDIINSLFFGLVRVTDAALMYTPLNNNELKNPRKEDQDSASALVGFLNEHLELSHKHIWAAMDNSRLFGLLDGFLAPHSGSRSVASVVENSVMGVIGNNLVLKVIPGERLDPVFRNVEDLLAYYKPTTKPDPYRVSVPTKGVYAESVMGKCNSCEEMDETRHWRFNDVPCGTTPTAIDPISTASRRADPGNLQPKDLPANLINLQTAPAAPDPTGLAAAFALLGKGDSFKDFTGLEGTQANALGALQTTSKSVTDLANISKDFASLAVMSNQKKDGANQIEQIKKLNTDGYLSDEEANERIKNVLDSFTNAADNLTRAKDDSGKTVPNKLADEVVSQGLGSGNKSVEYSKTSPDGEKETIKVTSEEDNDGLDPVINLSKATASSELLSFNPKSGDRSLTIEVEADFDKAPANSRLRWSADSDLLLIDTPDELRTKVTGVKPGIHDLDIELIDPDGNRVAKATLKLSVPQCITVSEDASLFDTALSTIKLPGEKNGIIEEAKLVAEALLDKANVRLFWQLGSYTGTNKQTVPSHVPGKYITTVIIMNRDIKEPPRAYSRTTRQRENETNPAKDVNFDEIIRIFPGMFHTLALIDVHTQVKPIIIQLNSDLPANTALVPILTSIYGRLIGESVAHEIGHAILGKIIFPTRHNRPPIAGALMNSGINRNFKQRTAIENTKSGTTPVLAGHFTISSIADIGGFSTVNQALIDTIWPIPPAHKFN